MDSRYASMKCITRLSIFTAMILFPSVVFAQTCAETPNGVCATAADCQQVQQQNPGAKIGQKSTSDCTGGKICCYIIQDDPQVQQPQPVQQAAPAPASSPSAAGYGFPDPFGGASIPTVISRIVQTALGLSGALFFVMFLWGGTRYLTAGGDSKHVESARKILVNAVIGLVIIGLSYVIVNLIFDVIIAGGRGVQTTIE